MQTAQQTIDWEQLADEELQRLAKEEQQSSSKRWAKYERPNPFSNMYGFGSTLYKLKGDMDNETLTPNTRKAAAKAYYEILRKVSDTKLMAFRERLIRAAQSENRYEVAKISAQMKDYAGEDKETGHYDV
jgi:anaerobic selenocysteine-containing dehydrogenase